MQDGRYEKIWGENWRDSLEQRKLGQGTNNPREIPMTFRSIMIFTTTTPWEFTSLLRLSASSYDIIDGLELLPPIVHVFTLFTYFANCETYLILYS